MKPPGEHFVVFLFLLFLCAAQCAYYGPLLPERVASHFDFDGAANGWSSRSGFLLMEAVLFFAVAFLFFLIPFLLRWIPAGFINVPHREYWLAPERREQTIRFLAERLSAMGNAVLCFLLLLFQLTIQANLGEGPPRLGKESWILFGGYAIYMIVWIVRLFKALRVPR